MLYIKNLEDGVELFKALGSDVRINIIKLLLKNREMNMNEIASCLLYTSPSPRDLSTSRMPSSA